MQISGGEKVKTATIVKANDQAEGVLTSFMGEEVVVGHDTDGDALTAFIVSPMTVQGAPEQASRLSDMQVLASDALREAIKQHGTGGAVALDQWKEELFRRGVLDSGAKNPREPFRRLRNTLARLRRIVEQDGVVRLGYAAMASPSIVPPQGGDSSSTTMPPLPVR